MYFQGLSEDVRYNASISASPRRDGQPLVAGVWQMPDGHRIGYSDLGAPHGYPLIYLPNHASSRLEGLFFHEQAQQAGFRLISIDRPGLGLSDFLSYRDPAVLAGPIAALADHLQLRDFGVMAWGGGGPFALALSWRYPERVRFMLGLASLAPPGADSPTQMLLRGASVQMTRLLVRLRYHVLRHGAGTSRYMERMKEQLCHADRKLFEDPAVVDLLRRDLRESMRQGPRGMAYDSSAGLIAWNFPPEEVRVPVELWQGSADTLVPDIHGERLCRRLRHCALHRMRHRGHFFAVREGAEIFRRARSCLSQPSGWTGPTAGQA